MPVCLPGVCRLLSNGASIYPSRVLVPLPCHAGMNVAAKVRQMSLKCSPVLPSEVFRLGIINPWKGLNVPSCGCVAFLHGKMQCAASSIAVRASPALRCVVPLAVLSFPVFRFLLPWEKPCPFQACGLVKRSSALRGVSQCAAWVGLWASDGCFMPFVRQ